MIILEAPYVSEVLLSYLANNGIPVLKNEFAGKLIKNQTELTLYNEQDFIEAYKLRKTKACIRYRNLRWDGYINLAIVPNSQKKFPY